MQYTDTEAGNSLWFEYRGYKVTLESKPWTKYDRERRIAVDDYFDKHWRYELRLRKQRTESALPQGCNVIIPDNKYTVLLTPDFDLTQEVAKALVDYVLQ